MMATRTDVSLYEIQGANGILDLAVDDNQIVSVTGLETAIDVSVNQDARASIDQVYGDMKRRGFVAQTVFDEQLGSLLWLLDQARLTSENLNRAISYTQKSLKWLEDGGYAKSVTVSGELDSTGIILYIFVNSNRGPDFTRQINLLRETV